jgi:hypothetical protein
MLPIPSLFEITKRSPLPYKSLVAPTGSSGRGIAYIEDPANPGNAILADGSAPIAGFVTRPILAGGPTLADDVFPNRLERPFSDSDPYGVGANMISLEQAEEVEAEGYDPLHVNGFLYSGTGGNAAKTITASTALKTPCSFRNGQFSVGVTGDYCEWLLQQIMPPQITGNVRARFIKVAGRVL